MRNDLSYAVATDTIASYGLCRIILIYDQQVVERYINT